MAGCHPSLCLGPQPWHWSPDGERGLIGFKSVGLDTACLLCLKPRENPTVPLVFLLSRIQPDLGNYLLLMELKVRSMRLRRDVIHGDALDVIDDQSVRVPTCWRPTRWATLTTINGACQCIIAPDGSSAENWREGKRSTHQRLRIKYSCLEKLEHIFC